MQMKGIFSTLLRSYEFEFDQPSESYVDDHSKMVVHLKQPCRVRFKPRPTTAVTPASAKRVREREEEEAAERPFRTT